MGCTMLSGAFESLDYGPSVEVEGRKYTKAAPTTGQAMIEIPDIFLYSISITYSESVEQLFVDISR